MSRRKQSGKEVAITLDRRFLFGCLGLLALVLVLGVGILAGQLASGGAGAPAPQPAAQLQQPQAPSNAALPQVQSEGDVAVGAQPVPTGSGNELTEDDATGLIAGDVMQSPCFVVNLLEFQKNVVRGDFRLTKAAETEGPHPQLAVNGLNSHCNNAYDFGHLESTEIGQATFTLENVGNEPLTVSGLYTSCGCTIAEVEGHQLDAKGTLDPVLELAPGDTKEFSIALDAKRVEDSSEPRIIQIFSNDPRGVPFGELWPVQGADRELRFAILSDVTSGGSSPDSSSVDQ
jgi:hypothetical protein